MVNSLFGAVKVNKKGSNDPKKWEFGGKGIAFVSGRTFSMGAQGAARNVVIFGVDNSSSKHPVNKKNDFMVLGNGTSEIVEKVHTIAEKGLAINPSRILSR